MFDDDDFKISVYNGEASLFELGKEVERAAFREFGFGAGGFRTSQTFVSLRSGSLEIKSHKGVFKPGVRTDDQVVDCVSYEPGDKISLEVKGGSVMITLFFDNYRKINLCCDYGPYDVIYCENAERAFGWVPAFAISKGPVVSLESVIREWHSNLSHLHLKESPCGSSQYALKYAHFNKENNLTPDNDDQLIILECDTVFQPRTKFNDDLKPIGRLSFCLVFGKRTLVDRLKSAFRSGKYWTYFEHLDAWATLSGFIELERACTKQKIGYVSGIITKNGYPHTYYSSNPSPDKDKELSYCDTRIEAAMKKITFKRKKQKVVCNKNSK